ncbi:MAG: Xaa-Pro peptidase family protein [Candidatus Micrarchaeaceae archaeon]
MEYEKRLKKLFENSKVDTILLVNGSESSSNFLYMTGFTSGVFEGTHLLLKEDGAVLFANALEYEIAKEEAPSYIEVEKVKSMKELGKRLLHAAEGKVLGFDALSTSVSSYNSIKKLAKPKRMLDISDAFEKMRGVKTNEEIECIRKAASFTKKAFSSIEGILTKGITEKEVAAEFDYMSAKAGSEKPSFDTIVCFGGNAALPHHMPDDTKLKENEFVLIDAGAKYMNYCSDMTRTFIFKPDTKSQKYKRMADMLDAVKKAQELARLAAKSGSFCDAPHIAAENSINAASKGIYKGKFIHSLGHSIGIDVHDSNTIALSKDMHVKLENNMVFSDEPGIYINGFGGVRIEDDMIITKKGGEFI